MIMRRAQFDKPIFFILALVVVAMVLYIGYLGINYMIEYQKEQEVRAFWNSLDSAISRNMNYGARETITLYLPRSDALCFFNVSATDKDCAIFDDGGGIDTDAQQLAGHSICEEMKGYWALTSAEAESDNIMLSSGRTKRNIRAVPSNEKYQCFQGSTIRIQLDGTGRYVNISSAS
jgi:hypothetical protein